MTITSNHLIRFDCEFHEITKVTDHVRSNTCCLRDWDSLFNSTNFIVVNQRRVERVRRFTSDNSGHISNGLSE